VLAPVVAYAQEAPWHPIARQCAQELNAQVGGNGASWEAYAYCTVRRYYGTRAPPDQVRACIQNEETRRWQIQACRACGHPVDDVVRCVGAVVER
jgi:hypothetical protein